MSSAQATTTTGSKRVAKAFGLDGEHWMRHANPASVWTRFTVLSLIALAVWSRDWIGIWCLIPVALAVTWMYVNPLFFKAPKSTRNWASRGVLGERIWVDRKTVELPAEFRSGAVATITNGLGALGIALLVYGLVELDLLLVVTGLLLTHIPKAWYIDRMSLLFAAMARRDPKYAAWDY
jgi:hypothetical protein